MNKTLERIRDLEHELNELRLDLDIVDSHHFSRYSALLQKIKAKELELTELKHAVERIKIGV